MLCPRCQQENPEGRGFCIRCAYPLPEEKRQEQVPVYEPIIFDQHVPVRNESPLNTQPRRRPVVLGIVGLVMGVLAILMAFYGIVFLSAKDMVYELFMEYAGGAEEYIEPELLAGIYGITFAIFGAVFGLLATIFGSKAKKRQAAEPGRYMGKGMYVAALILGIAALAVSAIVIAASVAVMK